LTEEILNSLARISELQVSARTSSFSFKGKNVKISTVARELNVGAILEASVRRAGKTVRVTAQLNNAVTGFHLWSQTYDRDLRDVLRIQTEIANAVASALKVTLLGDVAAKVEVGGTRNPAAFDAYLRGASALSTYQNETKLKSALTAYTEAIRLDPEYALAYAERSLAYSAFETNYATAATVLDYFNYSRADANKAVALAPNLGDGHVALAKALWRSLDFTRASEEYEHALALAPGKARVLEAYGLFAVYVGRADAGIAAVRRAVALDPLNPRTRYRLGLALMGGDRYREAIAAFMDAKAMAPGDVWINAWLGFTYYYSGDLQHALTTCEGVKPEDDSNRLYCLALTYHKLGRPTDADAVLSKLRDSPGRESAVHYALLYKEWGDKARALDWLETALRDRDPNLVWVKIRFDSLRQEPRFQAVMRELKFPD